MTTSSYTHGPFNLTKNDGELLVVAPDPDMPGCYGLLAQVFDCDFPDEALANGHLLAAAPDLLAALREIMIYTGEYPSAPLLWRIVPV